MPKKPRISAIAAVGKNCELGKNGDLIWRIKEDLGRVRDLTMGHPIIMGRKTHESIGKPLPGRVNIVVTRDPSYTADGCVVVPSVTMAIEKASLLDQDEIFIFGGAQIYEAALPYTNRLYLTEIDAEDPDADTFFPEYSNFAHVVESEMHSQDGLSYIWITREPI